MSVAPVMPVVTGTNFARCLPCVSFWITKTPCFAGGGGVDEAVEAASTFPLLPGGGGVYIVSDWIGSASTLALCAVVTLAVQERPGRNWSFGSSIVTTTLKSLASSVPVVDCDVATPVERSRA